MDGEEADSAVHGSYKKCIRSLHKLGLLSGRRKRCIDEIYLIEKRSTKRNCANVAQHIAF